MGGWEEARAALCCREERSEQGYVQAEGMAARRYRPVKLSRPGTSRAHCDTQQEAANAHSSHLEALAAQVVGAEAQLVRGQQAVRGVGHQPLAVDVRALLRAEVSDVIVASFCKREGRAAVQGEEGCKERRKLLRAQSVT